MCCNLPLPQEPRGAKTTVPRTFHKHYDENEQIIAIVDEELIPGSFKHSNKKIPKAEKQLILKIKCIKNTVKIILLRIKKQKTILFLASFYG